MSTPTLRAPILLGLLFTAGQAFAIPVIAKLTPTFYQSGRSNTAFAGMLVEANTSLANLTVGAGFTIQCTMSSLTHPVQHHASAPYNPLGTSIAMAAPTPIQPGSYQIPGWSTIQTATCNGECVMHHKAEALDSAVTLQVGFGGSGFNFQLSPSGQIIIADSKLISICRGGQPQCCTPGCAIP